MIIRPATETDRAAILRLMRPLDYNRINLHPDCFLVVEENGEVIGIGQIKYHREGTAELASLVVAAERRGEGIGTVLVQRLVARHRGPLYLFCLAGLESYYAPLGFVRVERRQLPLWLAFIHLLGNLAGRLAWLRCQERLRVIAMKTTGGATGESAESKTR
jgi:amino-acid N-acetyltransferase